MKRQNYYKADKTIAFLMATKADITIRNAKFLRVDNLTTWITWGGGGMGNISKCQCKINLQQYSPAENVFLME